MKTIRPLWLSFAFNVARLIQAFPAIPLTLINCLLVLEILHYAKFE